MTLAVALCAASSLTSASEPEAKPNVKKCHDLGITLEAVSIERRDAGQLFFTFTIESQANKEFRTYSGQQGATLIDDKGDKWEKGKVTIPTVHLPNTKSNATVLFTRALGGNESQAATVSFNLNVNEIKRCRVTFNKMPIS